MLPLIFLLASPRSDPYASEDSLPSNIAYDQTWHRRIAVGVFQILFVIAAILSFIITHAAKPIQSNRVDDDVENFDPALKIYK